MADCNNILEYRHEYLRMCNSYHRCDNGCPFEGKECSEIRGITEEHIQIVQKWSDENLELKPCPFCGEAQNKGFVRLYNGKYYGKCHECGVHTMDFDTAHDLIEYWNRRD